MKVKHFSIIVLFFISLNLGAQNITSEQSDCVNAVVFKDSIYGPLEIPKGYGKKLEIKGHKINNPYFFTEEHNTLWIKLIFTRDVRFVFEINPNNPNDDYDFSIFKINGPNYCDSIATNKILPVRSNICKRKPIEGSITGLREGYTNLFAAAGQSPSFSAPLDVKNGEEYYLVLDGPYGLISGFSIELKYENIEDTISEELLEHVELVEQEPKTIKLKVLDELGNRIKSPKIEVRSVRNHDTMFVDKDSLFTISNAKKFSTYHITITEKGFKQAKLDYAHRINGDTTVAYTLEKLKIGSKLRFENINFVGDEATILPTSTEDLENLTLFLKENPNINVEIGGHVNAKGKNRRIYKKLSRERAKAIFSFLLNQNIDESRMLYKGYGNSKLIYPNATSEKQSQANRRVEITVNSL